MMMFMWIVTVMPVFAFSMLMMIVVLHKEVFHKGD